jgi:hypothetical protein
MSSYQKLKAEFDLLAKYANHLYDENERLKSALRKSAGVGIPEEVAGVFQKSVAQELDPALDSGAPLPAVAELRKALFTGDKTADIADAKAGADKLRKGR